MTNQDVAWLFVVAAIVAVAILAWFFSREEGKGKVEEEKVKRKEESIKAVPFRVERSVSNDEASKAREELKTLEIEKEITSYALTRLYEAEAEGKLTMNERDSLVDKYKKQMQLLDSQIRKDQLVVDLHDLEGSRSELVKMFYDKFDEIDKKIEGIRSKLGITPQKVISVTPPATPEEKREKGKETKPKKVVKKKKKIPPPKTEAEEKIVAIREEVLKVLERLEQIETET